MAEAQDAGVPYDGLPKFYKIVIGWTVSVIVLNVISLIIKNFIRTLKDLNTGPENIDLFDYAHEYRYLLGSLVDFFNGISMLYCIHCIA